MNQRTFYQQLVERYVASTASKQELDLLFHLMDDEEFCEVMAETMDQHLLQNMEKAKQAKVVSLRKKRYRLVGVAASFILMISIASFYFVSNYTQNEKSKQPEIARANIITPGEDKAVLTLANGEKIILKEQNNELLSKEAGLMVYNSKEGALVYKAGAASSTSEAITYNTISTPRGGQYKLILEDGSKIWLNAASSIKFPTRFDSKQRKIEISGEVYCEISKDPKRPFRVSYGNQMVEVLGTQFNINAYIDEKITKTTLIEGSIRLANTQTLQSKLLTPGDQARMTSVNNQLNVNRVDIEEVIAWKEGYFMFNEEPLESIMRKVSRWYDVEVVYKSGIPQKKLGGKISKFNNVNELLDVLAATGSVKFEIQGRRIIVMN
ncbi:FecR family protein [Pedobacter glucosidilyticus]|uniref:FecR family protein n=1 Tax=Pedobacter glucosidilyticus TaxID=1122941 RepID=UPI00041DE071|nr:FecR domain-containing protein [Pedobacter glucosidilyticus]